MKDKKTIGFDILDNARLDEIDKIGTDMDMLDEKTKKRILEMTRKRYNDAIKGENTGIYDNAEDVVDNVEVYSRKKSSKIIMSVVNTAAALGLAVGSVFMVKNLGRGDNDIPDDPLLPSESNSVETAAANVLDYLAATDEFIDTMDYGYLDMNGDNVDELLVKLYSGDFARTYVYHYDGSEYMFKAQFIHGTDDPVICLDEKRIYTFDYEFDYYQSYSTWDDELNFTEGDKLERVWGLVTSSDENNTYTYFLNGETISEDEYKDKSENFVTGEATEYNLKNYYNKYDLAENMTEEELEIFNAIDEAIHNTINDNRYCFEILNPNEDVYKLKYGFMDFNGDSVDELIIHEELNNEFSLSIAYYKDCIYNYFQTSYSENIRFDAATCKMYSGEAEALTIDSWAGVDFSKHTTGEIVLQPDFYNVTTLDGTDVYTHNGESCDRAEYEAAVAEYEACPELNVDYIIYSVRDMLLKYKSAEKPVQNQPVELTQEEIARNKRIEDYIQFLYECHRDEGENFYESIKIDYAYLDINNDSIDELFIRYNLYDNPEYGAIDCNYFDGTEYIPFKEFGIDNDWKLNLQNRKYYTVMKEKTEEYDYCWLFISTWENVEISHESEYFTLQDSYYSGIDPFIDGTGEHVYLRNNEPCTKEEYENAIAEYENCVGAELKFIPYDINKAVFVGTSEGDTTQTNVVTIQKKKTTTTTTKTTTAVTTTTQKPTQEVLDKARDAALEASLDNRNKESYVGVYYSYYDLNDDSVPELFINFENNLDWGMEIYKFNGINFEFCNSITNNSGVTICKSKKQIGGGIKGGGIISFFTTFDDELNFSAVNIAVAGYNYDENGNMYDEYRFNDKVITKEEYESYMHNCEDCIRLDALESFTFYYNNADYLNEMYAREQILSNLTNSAYNKDIKYAYIDFFGDNVPEMLVTVDHDDSAPTVYIYEYIDEQYELESKLGTHNKIKLDMANRRLYLLDDKIIDPNYFAYVGNVITFGYDGTFEWREYSGENVEDIETGYLLYNHYSTEQEFNEFMAEFNSFQETPIDFKLYE